MFLLILVGGIMMLVKDIAIAPCFFDLKYENDSSRQMMFQKWILFFFVCWCLPAHTMFAFRNAVLFDPESL